MRTVDLLYANKCYRAPEPSTPARDWVVLPALPNWPQLSVMPEGLAGPASIRRFTNTEFLSIEVETFPTETYTGDVNL